MSKTYFSCTAAVMALALLAGCSTSKPTNPETAQPSASKTEETKAPTLKTGREAFQPMYVMAHGWAGDARPWLLQSVPTTDSDGKDGKHSVWRSSFASPSLHALKSFVWSGSHAEGASEPGVTAGVEDKSYNPNNSSTQIFDIAFLKVDSGKAFEVAQKHGGEKLTSGKNPLPVNYIADWNAAKNTLTWHVIYGPDVRSPKLKIAVNATTGEYINTEK